MTAELRPVPVANARELSRLLGDSRRPAILLSASVPYLREDFENEAERERNHRYVAMAQPQHIRLAVAELTRTALMRHAQVIFGAHPAISPMVLDAARNLGAPSDSILIFQSDFFADRIPGSTYELANWSAGRLFFTPRQPAQGERSARRQSLRKMRSLMVSASNLRGAIFVGGMDGVQDEATLFEEEHASLPRYAIASTGSAAQELFERSPEKFAGRLRDASVLTTSRSYSVLARNILDDMGIFDSGDRGSPRSGGHSAA